MKFLSSFCLFVILTGIPRGSIFADEMITLIDESFDSETLPGIWEPGGRKGSFTIVDGALRGVAQPDVSHGPSIGVPVSGHDLTVEFDVKFINPKGYFLFLIDGDSQFKGQAHLLRFSATGKRIQILQDSGDPASKMAQKKERDARGGKRIPPTAEQLADSSFYRVEPLETRTAEPAAGEWHHVRIEMAGNTVTARFDEGDPFTAKGTVFDVPKSRIVFLIGNSGDTRIDNVKVTDRAK